MDELEIKLMISAEFEQAAGKGVTVRVMIEPDGFRVYLSGGALSGIDVLQIDELMHGADLELAFTVNSKSQYDTIKFRRVARPERSTPDTPPPSDKVGKDKGTSPYSPVRGKYMKFHYQRYTKGKQDAD